MEFINSVQESFLRLCRGAYKWRSWFDLLSWNWGSVKMSVSEHFGTCKDRSGPHIKVLNWGKVKYDGFDQRLQRLIGIGWLWIKGCPESGMFLKVWYCNSVPVRVKGKASWRNSGAQDKLKAWVRCRKLGSSVSPKEYRGLRIILKKEITRAKR